MIHLFLVFLLVSGVFPAPAQENFVLDIEFQRVNVENSKEKKTFDSVDAQSDENTDESAVLLMSLSLVSSISHSDMPPNYRTIRYKDSHDESIQTFQGLPTDFNGAPLTNDQETKSDVEKEAQSVQDLYIVNKKTSFQKNSEVSKEDLINIEDSNGNYVDDPSLTPEGDTHPFLDKLIHFFNSKLFFYITAGMTIVILLTLICQDIAKLLRGQKSPEQPRPIPFAKDYMKFDDEFDDDDDCRANLLPVKKFKIDFKAYEAKQKKYLFD